MPDTNVSPEMNDSSTSLPLDKTKAMCRGHHRLFYDVDGETKAERERRELTAKALCSICEIKDACLEVALERPEPYGIWGGLTEEDRRRIRRRGS